MQVLLKYLIDPAAAPVWMRKAFRLFPAPILTVVAMLGGCVSSPPGDLPAQSNSAWELLAPGLEWRAYRPGGDYALTQFVALRIDPAFYSFRAQYRPADPLNLARWHDALPGAVAFVNANFFDTDHKALGLLIADGVTYGTAYQRFGGMLQVEGGYVRVRSTILEPYDPAEPLEQAVQAFPMLVSNGQASYIESQDNRISRRTLVGQDREGRIVLMATSSLVGMKLVDLSKYLAASDLGLVNAVNLDGGGSTMLALDLPGQTPYQIQSRDPVPTVLAIYPR